MVVKIKNNDSFDYGEHIFQRALNDDCVHGVNISSGINGFAVPEMYKKMMKYQINNQIFYNNYDEYGDNMCLKTAIKLYEKMVAKDNCTLNTTYADYISLTAGATQAIKYLFDYYKKYYGEQYVLMLGFHYYLYFKCCDYKEIPFGVILPKNDNAIKPTIEDIEEAIDIYNPKMIVLTMPFNPSGECYSKEEIEKLISILKKKHILLCYDKCQLDEFNIFSQYINVGKIIDKYDFQSNAIIINSQSKIRSIPGLRQGYIIANFDIIKFINMRRNIDTCSPSNMGACAWIMDLIFRTYKYSQIKGNKKYSLEKIVKIYMRIFKMSNDRKVNKEQITLILNTINMGKSYKMFRRELEKNWEKIANNYNMFNKVLGPQLEAMTKLEGGFNICVKFKKTNNLSQLDFIKNLYKNTNIRILSEDMFSADYNKQSNYWTRISLAYEPLYFMSLLNSINDYLNILKI